MKFRKFNELILTFFYVGKIKTAPGTWGSLAASLFWLAATKILLNFGISELVQISFWAGLTILAFIWALIGIRPYSLERHEFDHKSIVIDEVIGVFIAFELAFCGIKQHLAWSPLFFGSFLFCFSVFRYLDIFKPGAIGICDRKMKNSFGVIFDDVLCGILAGGLTNLALQFSTF